MAIEVSDAEKDYYDTILSQIQKLWQNYNACQSIEVILRECFSKAENPFCAALYLMANNDSFVLYKKVSLAVSVMKTFQAWLITEGNYSKSNLTSDIKVNAFLIVNSQKNMQLIKLVIDIYELISDKELFLTYIQEQLSLQRFKQACQAATMLKLHNNFSIKDFLIQLILQDKLTVVEDFLRESPEQQKQLVMFLDELLGKENSKEEIQQLVKELQVPDAKIYKYNHKGLAKLIGRYVKDFKIPPEVCPCYMNQQKKRALSFMVWKRYIDKTLEGESWKEMMLEIVKDSRKFQYELVDMLVEYCDEDEAVYWSKYFGLDKDKLPRNLLQFYGEEKVKKTVVEEESWDDDEVLPCPSTPNFDISPIPKAVKALKSKGISKASYSDSYSFESDWDMETSTGTEVYSICQEEDPEDEQIVRPFKTLQFDDQKVDNEEIETEQEGKPKDIKQFELNNEYHTLSLSEDRIIMVDTNEAFKELINNGLKDVEMVGIDCEWKPSFFTSKKSHVALIQLALWEKIYLIDVYSLPEHSCPLWSDFNTVLFENTEIIKIGFGTMADVTMILSTVPSLKSFGKSTFLDLVSVWMLLINKFGFKFPYEEDDKEGNGQSLAQLVSLCFNKVLDKSDQFSNWENRPLRRSQKLYAALDAYCLLEIYDYLKNACTSQGIPFEDVVSMALKGSKHNNTKHPKAKKHKRRSNETVFENAISPSPPLNFPPATPQTFKMVCDTMIQGLGRKLRSCGINTWIMHSGDHPDQCVKVALRDKRIILTRGSNYYKFVKYVSPSQCYQVQCNPLDDQVKEVLSHFRIDLKEEDIFSRCQLCNDDSFLEIHNSLLKKILFHLKDERGCSVGSKVRYGRDDSYAGMAYNVDFGKKWQKKNSIKELKSVCTKTPRGVDIKFHAIPDALFDKVEYFYACEKCGKVYWDGGHWKRELSRKKDWNLIQQ